MQTEADVPPVTALPIEESSTVTRFTLVKEEPVTDKMTVKETVEPADEEDEQVLCLPPGEASTGDDQEQGAVEHGMKEFRYSDLGAFFGGEICETRLNRPEQIFAKTRPLASPCPSVHRRQVARG
jgi:hypothetical protein